MAGLPESMQNETIDVIINPHMNGIRVDSPVISANCYDWYQADSTGEVFKDFVVDLEKRTYSSESDIAELRGNTYTITLSWHNLTASYIVKFADDYHVQ